MNPAERFASLLALACLAGVLLGVPLPVHAASGPVPGPGPGLETGGDSPPAPLYFFTGHGGLVCDVTADDSTGTLTIAGIPAGATVDRAFFVTGIWTFTDETQHTMHFTFAGTSYGTVAATTLDVDQVMGALDLGGYVVDVTAQVTGNGSYTFEAVPDQTGTGPFGSLLAVVYSHAGSPGVGIQLNAGGESLQNSSSVSTFAGVVAGPATLHLFVEADDTVSGPNESIAFNGATVLGPGDVFDANEGPYASYFALPVAAANGNNPVTVTTGDDWFGWHFAALVYPIGATPTTNRTWGQVKRSYR